MTITPCWEAFRDARGGITDVLKACPVDNVSLLTASAGSVRGHHYHLEATVFVFILSGRFKVFSRVADGPLSSAKVGPGELIEFPPLDSHALRALEDGSFLLLARGTRGGKLTIRDFIAEAAA